MGGKTMNNNKVIIIPKKEEIPVDLLTGKLRKKRVAAYARVSTDEEDQLNSYNAQIDEFEKRIKANPDWEFVGMYADEGITGTSTKHRKNFNLMIDAALAGEIDLILVKSISRFARNTIDCLKTKRALQEKGVEIFFEKENISSLDERAETMLTIYASFAQEESRSISTNVTWGVRKRMRDGTWKFPAKTLIGYKKNDDGFLEIVPEEALIIQKIFNYFMDGFTYREIIDLLDEEGIKRPKSRTGKWNINVIYNILGNEKYCGDLLFQKTYVKSYLTHERTKNDGKLDKYLFQNVHEAIIDRANFEYVQLLKKKRGEDYIPEFDKKGTSLVSGIIRCASCGRLMKKITYRSSTNVLTCKAIHKLKEGDNVPCEINETLDFDLVIEAAKEVTNLYKKEIDYSPLINATSKCQFKEDYLHFKVETQNKIEELESKMNTLIKESIKQGNNISDYLAEINSIKREIETLKLEVDEFDNNAYEQIKISTFCKDLYKFCGENNEITKKISSMFIKLIYRLMDNSILFVISKEKVEHKAIFPRLNELAKLAVKNQKTITKNNKTLTYYIADLEELKWN